MTLRHLNVFIAVCLEGSVTKAAQKLYISQPTVSLIIQELENHYGKPLFDRYGKRLHITPFGREMLHYAMSITNMLNEMELRARDHDKSSQINVGCGIAFGKLMMPKIVKAYQTRFPQCGLHITVLSFSAMVPLLLNSQVDFCIVESVARIDELEYQPFMSVPIVGICHVDNPLAKKAVVYPQDLNGQPLLLRHSGSPVRQAVDMFLNKYNIHASCEWDSVSALALVNGVAENLGISFLPLNHVMSLSTPQIHIMNVQGLDIRQIINIVYRKGKTLTQPMNMFIQCCLDTLREDGFIDPYCPFENIAAAY